MHCLSCVRPDAPSSMQNEATHALRRSLHDLAEVRKLDLSSEPVTMHGISAWAIILSVQGPAPYPKT